MRFDPNNWREVKPNEKVNVPQGVLRVCASDPGALYLETSEGVEALVGFGSAWDVETAEEMTFHVALPRGGRVFFFVPSASVVVQEGEVFTNIDRLPDESGSLAEVRRALRTLEMQRRDMLREMREVSEARVEPELVEPVEQEKPVAQ